MATGQKLLAIKCDVDISADYIKEITARYIKNLTSYVGANDRVDGIKEGQNTGKLKSQQQNELYVNFIPPAGENYVIGAKGFGTVNRVYVACWNSNNNHFIYRINGDTRTMEIVKIDPCFNFQLLPEFFIHESGMILEVVYLVDQTTGETIEKEDLYWTDGFNPQGYIRVNDCIDTNGFDENLYPYFIGDYDKCILTRMGVPTPMDCIKVFEIPNISDEVSNNIKFQGLQFRILGTDVWGRPSEHGIISDLYIWGNNNCSGSDNGARCLNLFITVTNPIIDILQIEYSRDNSNSWIQADTIFLYDKSSVGKWWLRGRNPKLPFNQITSTYTYVFCNDKERIPIDPNETNRTENPIPQTSQAITKLNKFIALANNKYGFEPFSQELLDNVSVELVEKGLNTGIGNRKAEIFLTIYNPVTLQQQPVWTIDSVEHSGVFGGTYKLPNYPSTPIQLPTGDTLQGLAQAFGNPQQRGLIGVLIGTSEPPITVVSEQYYLDPVAHTLIKLESFDAFDYNKTYFQKFTFTNLKAAKYIFQLCSASSKLSDTQYWKTSATLFGSFQFTPATKAINYNTLVDDYKQIVIDLCSGDYDGSTDNKIPVIYDLCAPAFIAPAFAGEWITFCAGSGYMYEDVQNNIGINPVELLKQVLVPASPATGVTITVVSYSSTYTDHNGFYFVLASTYSNIPGSRNQPISVKSDFYGYCNASYIKIITKAVGSAVSTDPFQWIEVKSNLNLEGNCMGYLQKKCNHILVQGTVLNCDSNLPVPGVGVVLFHSGYAITNEDGQYTIVAHDNGVTQVPRTDDLYFIQNPCGFTDCADNYCIDVQPTYMTLQVFQTPPLPCNERFYPALLQLVKITSLVSNAHLLSGGSYGACLVAFDWTRRHGFAQTADHLFFNVPTLAQSGGKYYTARLIINPNANFPVGTQLLTAGMTQELTIQDYVEWIVDSFLFIDNSGEENVAAPTQIKIFYKSLNEYNKQNEFNTTTPWQFISEVPDVPRTSDYVDFLINGDGSYFPKAVRQIVKYNKDGVYFLINYDSTVINLKKDARIRLVRPKINDLDRSIFYENCLPIKVINQKAQQNSIDLPFFDTYEVYRQIPIPVPSGDTFINEIITFGTPFEHHSPNDLWGYKIKNIGRVFASNPYESVILRINEIALSGAMSDNGVLNFLSYFDDAKKTVLNVNNTGGIYGLIADIGKLFIIAQYDSYLIGVDDNLGRVNSDGTFQAPSTPDTFGKPQRVSGDNYGCQAVDKNTIRVRNGLIMFADRGRGEIMQYNYSNLTSMTKDKCDSWFRAKCRELQKDANRYLVFSINPVTNELIVTDFSIKSENYINNERTYKPEVQETVSFDITTRNLNGWWSFTAEYYAYLDGDVLNNQLFSFKQALPYNHYNLTQNTKYNTFFGVKCGRVFRLVSNLDNFKVKMFRGIELYGNSYFADEIFTSSGQKSRLLLSAFDRRDNFYAAAFMSDLNTPADTNLVRETGINKLMDGNPLYGSYIDIRFIGDPDEDDKYTEVLGIIVNATGQTYTGGSNGGG